MTFLSKLPSLLRRTSPIIRSSSSTGQLSLSLSLSATKLEFYAHLFKLSAIKLWANPSNFLFASFIWLYCVLKITLYWICSTSDWARILSPIHSFSMQKLVFKALPIALPPFSEMPQLKISSSTSVWWPPMRFEIAWAPTSPRFEFLNFSSLNVELYSFRI